MHTPSCCYQRLILVLRSTLWLCDQVNAMVMYIGSSKWVPHLRTRLFNGRVCRVHALGHDISVALFDEDRSVSLIVAPGHKCVAHTGYHCTATCLWVNTPSRANSLSSLPP